MLIPPYTSGFYSINCSGENIDLRTTDQNPTPASTNNSLSDLGKVFDMFGLFLKI